MEDEKEKPTILIELGTGNCKIGFSGEDEPFDVFQTLIGKSGNNYRYKNNEKYFLGHEVEENFGYLNISFPIENGIIKDWDAFEKLIEYTYKKEFKLSSEIHNLLLSEAPLTSNKQREKIAEILFEKFKIPGLAFICKSILALYNYGLFSSLVHGSGEGVTYFYPVYDGYPLKEGIIKNDFGGKNINELLLDRLIEKKININMNNIEESLEIVRDIKEKCCYIPRNYNEELLKCEEMEYELPDGNKICLKEERIICPECMFKPRIIGKSFDSMDFECIDSINRCDITLKNEFLQNIILAGGNTYFKGYDDRLWNELKPHLNDKLKRLIRIRRDTFQKFIYWNGMSIMSSLTSFCDYLVKKYDYEENGPNIINKNS